jgi:4-hydroxy-L-threonine phosphate dehydrogenase PdxA
MSVIVTYFKLADDLSDKKTFKSLVALLFYKRHLKKAKGKYPEEYKYIKEQLKRLSVLEREWGAKI